MDTEWEDTDYTETECTEAEWTSGGKPPPQDLPKISAAAALESLLVAYRGAYAQLDEIRQAKAARRESRDRARTELAHGVSCILGVCRGWFGLIRRADLVAKLGRSSKEVSM